MEWIHVLKEIKMQQFWKIVCNSHFSFMLPAFFFINLCSTYTHTHTLTQRARKTVHWRKKKQKERIGIQKCFAAITKALGCLILLLTRCWFEMQTYKHTFSLNWPYQWAFDIYFEKSWCRLTWKVSALFLRVNTRYFKHWE